MHYFFLLISLTVIKSCTGSSGDSTVLFQRCVHHCNLHNCSESIENNQQPLYLRLLQWSCWDECNYNCMWQLVEAFEKNGKTVPQFYGKWPFIRLFGIQEPASVLFSIWNFYAHVSGILKFRKRVRNDSPLYYTWHAVCMISLNAWSWSTIFHTRDFPMTEFMDYASAFSIVLISCYCVFIRVLREFPSVPRFIKVILTIFFITFYYDHISYLRIGNFDYRYNMQVNILVGSVTLFTWFLWALYNHKRQPYVWKIALFVTLCAATLILEIIDRPPLFYMLDCHALWHFTSIPLTYLLYSFAIDDCRFLRNQDQYKLEKSEAKKKL